jgi:hypothetical protein
MKDTNGDMPIGNKEIIFEIIKGKSFLKFLGDRRNKCKICGKYFKERGNLLTHIKIHVIFY